MSEKTPFQLMREQHQSRIQAQKQAANYRAYAFKHGIAFTNQADLHAKMSEIEAEQQRIALARKQEKERISQQSVSYTPSPTPTPVTHDIAPSPSFTSSDGGGTSSSDGGTCSGGGGGSCD